MSKHKQRLNSYVTVAILNARLLIVIVSVMILREVHMISQTALFKYIAACLISIAFVCQPLKADEDIDSKNYTIVTNHTIEDIGKAGLIVGAAGFATYALTKLGSWLFTKSDTIIADQAYTAILQAQAQYTSITTILNKEKLSYNDELECIQSISEPVLYEIAKAKYYDADITLYLRRLDNTIKNTESHLRKVRQSIQSLQSNSDIDHEATRLIARMHAIENMMNTILPSLKFAYTYLKHHATFFLLFETEDTMMYRYEQSIQVIDRYPNDMNTLREIIHQSVMIYQRRHYSSYPYHWYLKRLEDDIHSLHVAMNKLSYEYTNRYNVAYTLCNKLESIRTALLSSPYYTQEIRDYEYAQLAQAAIDAQKHDEQLLNQNNVSF